MQKEKKKPLNLKIRYTSVAVLFLAAMVFFAVKLVSVQLAGRDFYQLVSAKTYTRYETIEAQRGEIYDRNGKALVSNDYTYTLSLDYSAMPAAAAGFNGTILTARKGFDESGHGDAWTLADTALFGTYPDYVFNEVWLADEKNAAKFAAYLEKHKLKSDISCADFVAFLSKKYKLLDSDSLPSYTKTEMHTLLVTRFNMEITEFGPANPYVLSHGAGIELITYLSELKMTGFLTSREASRVYNYPGYASHILGRVGKIQAENADAYLAAGYSLDATVGISGVESAFEEYLRGTDGLIKITEDAYGNILSEEVSKPAVAGKDIYLTIDIDMQIIAEDALAANIQLIVDKALATSGERDGEDAAAGAITVVDPSCGEVLVLASNPTYNLVTFSEDYEALAANKNSPFNNRSLTGLYQPGSTFKPATAACALTNGIITPYYTFYDTGTYTFFKDYRPHCWIFFRNGGGHGTQNVVQAIQNSCNCFFFEVGRLTTIETLVPYCKSLGLGEKTGIELAESEGILASPEYKENNGLGAWNPGDVLQAAIGQSYHQFTPLQISMYVSTLINGGSRYRAHLLYAYSEIESSGGGQDGVNSDIGKKLVYTEPEILNTVEISPDTVALLKSAMKDVVESGSAARLFRSYPITIGGKTGTAQVGGDKSENALFTAFAPFNDPKLEATCVIEQGANGTDAGYTVRDIFNYYFKLDVKD